MFNLISFDNELNEWNLGKPVIANEFNCQKAVKWIDQLQSKGGTCTNEALTRAFYQLNSFNLNKILDNNQSNSTCKMQKSKTNNTYSKGIYLITDGKPDKSCLFVLKNINQLWQSNELIKNENIYHNNLLSLTNGENIQTFNKNIKKINQLKTGPTINSISFTEEE